MTSNGAHDFDFVYGHWNVHNTKLRDVSDPKCDDWVEFDATSEAFPILHGLGHIDRIYVPDPPDGEPFEGLTLRLYDPVTADWSIWWSSTRAPGRLDPPMTGRFIDGHGVFEGSDTVGGRDVMLRFNWHADPSTPLWEQSFSYDSGATWSVNWRMALNRIPTAATHSGPAGAV